MPLLCVRRCGIRRVRLVIDVDVLCIRYVDLFFNLVFASVRVVIQGGWRREIDVASWGWSLTQIYGC